MPDYYVQQGMVGISLLSSTAAASASTLTATFDLVLPVVYRASALDIIYAHGDVASDGTIQQHTVLTSLPIWRQHWRPHLYLCRTHAGVRRAEGINGGCRSWRLA